jgi:hypothetical protein
MNQAITVEEPLTKMSAHVNGKEFHPDEKLASVLFSPPNATFQLYGYVDGIHGRCVDGWIFDATSPNSTLAVEICDGQRTLGIAQARLFRADLDAVGVGSTRSGSSCPRTSSTAEPTRSGLACKTQDLRCPAALGEYHRVR